MTFIATRMRFFFMIAILFYVFSKFLLKEKRGLLVAITFLLCWAIWTFPIENLYLRFNTLKESIHYSFQSAGQDALVVSEDENVAAYFYMQKDHTNAYSIIKKDDRGWKVVSPNFRTRDKRINSNYSITKCTIGNGICFFTIRDMIDFNKPTIKSVSDSSHSKFKFFMMKNYFFMEYCYCAFVRVPPEGYTLYINDEFIKVE